ncbi:hypothetical protein PQG02_06885 [Nostoc sp. UHCC 0926]|uniref:hypothetical protein n=1 Tax=unclassified Nostoc TaxID=2593658 RepID=UPI00235E43C3|nr:hypothetical protein [Nostoc sp. UHCC 0926]WDD34066.1 hypothetical protein PQG02_06885 [Nostoc sp. UHCC 0926]
MDSLINILYLIRNLFVGIVRLMYLLEQLRLTLQKLFPHSQTQASYQSTPPRPKSGQKRSSSYLNDPKNRKLQQDLITMLRGDIATAKRLLRYERQRHPGNSDNWYLEKVIGDLERDRR